MGVALVWLWCGFRVALGWLWVAYWLPSSWLWSGSGVALDSLPCGAAALFLSVANASQAHLRTRWR